MYGEWEFFSFQVMLDLMIVVVLYCDIKLLCCGVFYNFCWLDNGNWVWCYDVICMFGDFVGFWDDVDVLFVLIIFVCGGLLGFVIDQDIVEFYRCVMYFCGVYIVEKLGYLV